MSVNITLYNNQSELNKIGKTLVTLAGPVSAVIKDETSIIDPVITVSGISDAYAAATNYIYVDAFARYYFVNDVKSIRNGVWQLSCHVDVLDSFKTGILNQYAIVARQEKYWNLFINDGEFKIYQNSIIGRVPFPSGFTAQTPCYVLAVAGGGSGGGGS